MNHRSFGRTSSQTAHDLTLPEHDDEQRGDDGQNGAGHHQSRVEGIGRLQLRDADLDGLHLRCLRDQQGPEEGVPVSQEGVDGQRGDGRAA